MDKSENERRLELLVEQLEMRTRDQAEALRLAKVALWRWNTVTNAFSWSEELYRITARDRLTFAVTLQASLDCIHPEDVGQVQSKLLAMVGEKLPCEHEYRVVRPGGEIVHIWSSARPIFDHEHQVVEVQGICQDITARARAELALRESEEHYRNSVELSPQIPWIADREGRILEAGPRWYSLTGMSPQDALGVGWLSAVHPDDVEYVRGSWLRSVKTGEPYDVEHRVLLPNGTHRWCRARGAAKRNAEGKVVRWYGTLEDVHDRKVAEEALRESEQRFRLMADDAPVIIWVSDANGATTFINRLWRETTGQAAEESLGIGWLKVVHPDDSAKVKGVFETAFARRKPYRNEYRLSRASGGWAWVIDVAQPRYAADGTFMGYVGSTLDITERREAELALHESEERYRLLADHAKDIINRFDLNGIRTYVSPACRDILGYEPEELVGTSMFALVHPDDLSAVMASREELLSGRRSDITITQRMRHKSGDWVTLESHRALVKDARGKPVEFLGIARDVTERLKLEGQLRQAQKMETVGQLTGGIAHDFNNLLTVILGNTEILVDSVVPGSDLRVLAQMSLEAAERGAELTRQLLAFSRRQPLQPRPVDVHNLLVGMNKLLRRTLSEDIGLLFQLNTGTEPWDSFIDPAQLESAILNLCLNARDAMPSGGRLTVESRNVTLDQSVADIDENVKPGEYVLISVSDTGVGMTSEVLERVFEPFFTTKEVGKGSGLGLSMVYGFITQSRGHVSIYSEPGQGTTVKLYLPRAASQRKSEASSRGADLPHGGSERVLVVEDDPPVLDYVTRQLKSLGYAIESASNGPAALEMLKKDPGFDLLFTDVVMPGGMDGPELARHAAELLPRLPVLFTSGYTEHSLVHQGRLASDVHLLSKPYRRSELAAKLKEVLGSGLGGR